MDATVVVQGVPASPALRDVLLTTCSDALRNHTCAAEPSGDAAAIAIVTWPDGDLRRVRVVLEKRDGAGEVRLAHESRFREEDPPAERWRAVALVISALVMGAEPPADAAQGTQRGPASPDPAAKSESPAGWVELAGLLGPGLDDGSVRAGATFGAAWSVDEGPGFLCGSLGYATRPVDAQGLAVRWLTIGTGGGLTWALPAARIALQARGEVLLQQVKATMPPPLYTALAGGQRWSPGARATIELVWPARGPVALLAGLHLSALAGGTGIRLDKRPLGSSEWLSYAGAVGVQCSFR